MISENKSKSKRLDLYL